MLLTETFIAAPQLPPKKSLIEIVQNICEENEPKPFYCELPDDLIKRSVDASGTTQTTTSVNSSMVSGTTISTTTTL